MNKKVGIVVLFWNDYKKTIVCLESICNQKKVKFFHTISQSSYLSLYFLLYY